MLAGRWQDFKVSSVSADGAQSLAAEWNHLSANAIQSAGCNAPELILPLLKQVGGADLQTVVHGPDLLMAFPVSSKTLFLKTWETPLTSCGLPHLNAELSASVLLAFINDQTKPVLFNAIPSQGPFIETLKKQSAHFQIIQTWQRAALKPTGSFDDWLQTNFDQKRRKEFKRLRNRLSEQGDMTTDILQQGQDINSFVNDLLSLESRGWKGGRGTAIAANPKLKLAFEEACANLHRANKLRFWSLKLNGKAIASLYAIVEGDQAWLGKIAYDEAFAKYSPGVQIIIDCTESFFAEPNIKLIDSTAIPNHPMIDRIWRDRIEMVNVFVAPLSISKFKFNAIVKLEQQRMHWRGLARDAYYKLKGQHRS
jgi:CelD/BcsL family acetyltransferase involved in cellulose biosynthesis